MCIRDRCSSFTDTGQRPLLLQYLYCTSLTVLSILFPYTSQIFQAPFSPAPLPRRSLGAALLLMRGSGHSCCSTFIVPLLPCSAFYSLYTSQIFQAPFLPAARPRPARGAGLFLTPGSGHSDCRTFLIYLRPLSIFYSFYIFQSFRAALFDQQRCPDRPAVQLFY